MDHGDEKDGIWLTPSQRATLTSRRVLVGRVVRWAQATLAATSLGDDGRVHRWYQIARWPNRWDQRAWMPARSPRAAERAALAGAG